MLVAGVSGNRRPQGKANRKTRRILHCSRKRSVVLDSEYEPARIANSQPSDCICIWQASLSLLLLFYYTISFLESRSFPWNLFYPVECYILECFFGDTIFNIHIWKHHGCCCCCVPFKLIKTTAIIYKGWRITVTLMRVLIFTRMWSKPQIQVRGT